MKLIDTHVHFFPSKVAKIALYRVSKKEKITAFGTGTIENLISVMDNANVNLSINLPIVTSVEKTFKVNESALEHIKPYKDRILTAGTVHPKFTNPEELEKLFTFFKENNINLIKLHPEYQTFFVDDPSMLPIYKMAEKYHMVILFHSGTEYASPQRLNKVLDYNLDLDFIFAHMGGLFEWNNALDFYKNSKHLYLDTSFMNTLDPKIFKNAIQKQGADHILFGSDYPWVDPLEMVQKIKALDLSEEEEEAIFYKTASCLLHLDFK